MIFLNALIFFSNVGTVKWLPVYLTFEKQTVVHSATFSLNIRFKLIV